MSEATQHLRGGGRGEWDPHPDFELRTCPLELCCFSIVGTGGTLSTLPFPLLVQKVHHSVSHRNPVLFGFLWFQHLVLGWVEGRSPERPGRQGGPLLSFSICRLLRWLYGGQTRSHAWACLPWPLGAHSNALWSKVCLPAV